MNDLGVVGDSNPSPSNMRQKNIANMVDALKMTAQGDGLSLLKKTLPEEPATVGVQRLRRQDDVKLKV